MRSKYCCALAPLIVVLLANWQCDALRHGDFRFRVVYNVFLANETSKWNTVDLQMRASEQDVVTQLRPYFDANASATRLIVLFCSHVSRNLDGFVAIEDVLFSLDAEERPSVVIIVDCGGGCMPWKYSPHHLQQTSEQMGMVLSVLQRRFELHPRTVRLNGHVLGARVHVVSAEFIARRRKATSAVTNAQMLIKIE